MGCCGIQNLLLCPVCPCSNGSGTRGTKIELDGRTLQSICTIHNFITYFQLFLYLYIIKVEESALERSGHVVKQGVSQDGEDFEANLDPKVRKGLERIRKLDAILADKLKVSL